MKKLKLILTAFTLLLGWNGAWADVVPTVSSPSPGNTYYLYNPATQKFLFVSNDNLPYVQLEGNAWDILESDKDDYIKIRLKGNETGYFWGKFWAAVDGDYASYPEETYFHINEVSAGSTYKLHSYGWDGTSNAYVYINAEAANGWRVACNSQEQAGLDEKYTIWQFVTEANYATYMSQKYGTNVSSNVNNTTFETNVNDWTATGSFQNSQKANNQKGAFDGFFGENWDGSAKVNKMYQDVNLTSNGVYTLRMAAFVNNLGSNNQYIFANDDKTYLATTVPTFYEVQTLVKNKTISIGLEQTGTTANWMGIDNVRLFYLGNNVEYYSPTAFTSGSSATADTWYKVTDVSAGWYKIASNAAIDFYYTQDNSANADETENVSISQNGYTYLKLDEGTLYFKSSAGATITFTEGFVANDDITAFFLTNPNFTGNATGWEGNPAYMSNNAEKFNTTFDVYQTATDLPAGYYWIKAQAFDRETDQTATFESASSVSKAYLYAGNASTLVKRIYDDASPTQKNGGTNELSFTKNSTTVYIPNMPGAGEKYFDAGLYDNELLMYHGGGNLRIGIKKYVTTSKDWCLFDNFRIIYAGSTPTISNGTDMTSFITNPSFETGDLSSWTNQNNAYSATSGSDLSNKVGTYYASVNTNTSKSLSQTVSHLPAGIYVLSVNARIAHSNANYGTSSINMGGNSTPIPCDFDATTYYVAYNASNDASASISFSKNGVYGYRYFDNFTLTYYSTLPDVSGVNDLLASTMAGDVRAALDAANTAYTGSKTVANYNALQTAIVNAKVSIADFAAKTGTDADWTGIIQNPSFENGSGSTTGWTYTSSDDSGAKENSNGTYTMSGVDGDYLFNIWRTGHTISQTLKNLPAGSYKLTAVMGTDAGKTFRLKMGDNTGIAASSESGKGTGVTVTVYAKLTAKGDLTISADAGGSQWYKVDNFQLTYNPTLPASVTAVEGKMNSTVASTQTSAVSTYNSTNNIDNLVAAQTAIYNAHLSKQIYTEIATIKSNYDTKADVLDATGQAYYAASSSATKYTNGTYETASEAETAYHDDYIAAIKAQDTDNAVFTNVLVNPSFESFGTNNVPTGWTLDVGAGYQSNKPDEKKKEGSLVEGGGDYYFAFWTNNPSGSKVHQTINLPAGTYKLSAYVYTAGGTTIELKAGTLATDSKTPESNSTFKMEVSFSLTSATDVEVSIGTTSSEAWYNMDDCQLILTASYYANATDYSNLNSAITTATTTYYNHLGFENGEYAPYNNIDALTKLATAQGIDQDASNLKTTVQTATTNLEGATWTPNDGEVNAIYDGTFSNAPVYDATGGVNGWSAAVGLRQLVKSEVTGSIVTTGMYVWHGNSVTYGETSGYTLPLAAGTIYKLTYDRASWDGGTSSHTDITITDPSGTALGTATEGGYAGDWDSTDGTLLSRSIYFVTTTAGDYKLSISPWGNTVYTNMVLKQASDLTFADGSVPSYIPGTYPSVKVTRSLAKDRWVTAIYPFAVTAAGAGVEVATLASFTDGALGFSTSDGTSVANKPFLMRASSAKSELTLSDVAVAAASATAATAGKAEFRGVYSEIEISEEDDFVKYVLSNNNIYRIESTSAKVAPYRGYFAIDTSEPQAAKALRFVVDGQATNVDAPEVAETEEEEVLYNMAGVRVDKNFKGFVINQKGEKRFNK